jgi:hypothetical protein
VSESKEDSALATEAPVFVKVTNKRHGAIHAGPVTFPPGTSFWPVDTFKGFKPGLQEALGHMAEAGELEFARSETSVEAAPPAPLDLGSLEPPPPDPEVLPADDAAALAAIEAETNPARLDAWFQSTTSRPAVSEALLARISAL